MWVPCLVGSQYFFLFYLITKVGPKYCLLKEINWNFDMNVQQLSRKTVLTQLNLHGMGDFENDKIYVFE